ncbi:hypothetical protein D4R89_05880 [bacterium]|nr:MAG: hypothetical protein D4R89_05880 [bacterium]
MWLFDLALILIFSALGALCAFVITYGEYLKHYPDKKRPLKMAAQTALAAFAFFAVITFLLTFLMRLFIK